MCTSRRSSDYDGAGTDGSAVLMPLSAAQQFLHQPGRIKYVLVSNRGGSTSGAAATDQVVRMLRPAIAPLGLQANPTKQDALETADAMGAAFVSMFTTFGSFSIAAGILLIFLIFIMLAAERSGRSSGSPARWEHGSETSFRCSSSRASPTTCSPLRSGP